MTESVAQLRARWTPEATEAALRLLRGEAVPAPFGEIEYGGKLQRDLRGIRIEQAQFDALLIKNVNLRWATVHDVGFKGVRLVKCNLSQASITACYLRRARLERCDAVNARFERCDFTNARIEESRLDFASFRECEITLDAIAFRRDATPLVLERMCRTLKLNAISMGHFADAGDLTYLEKTYERHALHAQAFARDGASPTQRLHALLRWLGSLTYSWMWGYGERPGRLVAAIAVNIFVFGTLQYWLNAVPGSGWWAHVYFSGITFLTIGYGDMVPIEALPRLVSVIEGGAGIATLGLLIASATKKIMHR